MSIEFKYTQDEVDELCKNYYKKGRNDLVEELDHAIFNDRYLMANMKHEVYKRLLLLIYSKKES